MNKKVDVGAVSPDDQTSGMVQRILSTLSSNHGLIAKAIDGPLMASDGYSQKCIVNLTGARVLLPYDEDAYYLDPKLRGFLLEKLNHFSAYETVTRNTHNITKVKHFWDELGYLTSLGEYQDAVTLEHEIYVTVTEMIHNNERNLELLNAQISTDYGNCASIIAKMRQNESYGKQAGDLLRELIQISELIDAISATSRGEIMQRARSMVVSRLGGRVASWNNRLNDVIAVMSKRYFQNRVLEKRVRDLSDVALWLTKNPTIDGIEVHVDETIDPGALEPIRFAFRPRFDWNDRAPAVEVPLQTIMQRLPAREDAVRPGPEKSVHIYTGPVEPVRQVIKPVEQMVYDLVKALKAKNAEPISVRDWQPEKRKAEGLDLGQWLMYAATQLSSRRIKYNLEQVPRPKGVHNDVFVNIIALPIVAKPAKTQ